MKKYLAIILGVGFLHRLLFLGTRQLWTDELMQARIVKSGSLAEMLRQLNGGMDLASPIDFIVQRFTSLLLGDSTWALRMHAVIFGTLSIWVVYRIASFLFSERVALYTAVLFTFFPLAYDYSQEARPYALVLLLSLLSYDLLLRQVYGERRHWRGWVYLACLLTLLLYTSFLGLLIMLSQLVSLALAAAWKLEPGGEQGGASPEKAIPENASASWRQVAAYVAAAGIALALFYPWVQYVGARPMIAPASEIVNPKTLLRLIKELGDHSYPVAGLLLIGLLAGVRALLQHRRRCTLQWLLVWFLLPIPVLLGAEVWAGYFFAIRHLLHATPPLLLIAGYGMSYVGERLTILAHLPYQVSSPAIVYAGLLVIMCAYIGQSHARTEPADWYGTASFLESTLREGDLVAMPQVSALLEYYYPNLEAFRADDLDPGPGALSSGSAQRRIVVCYDKLWPDPCSRFRTSAGKDPAWHRYQIPGFTLFTRTK